MCSIQGNPLQTPKRLFFPDLKIDTFNSKNSNSRFSFTAFYVRDNLDRTKIIAAQHGFLMGSLLRSSILNSITSVVINVNNDLISFIQRDPDFLELWQLLVLKKRIQYPLKC